MTVHVNDVNMTVVTTARRSYHHGDLRNALVEAATSLADRHGPSAVTVREACRQVGVSPAAAYRHFADQAALLDAVADAALRELAARMRTALAAVPEGADAGATALTRFRSVGLSYVDYALARPGLFRTAYVCPAAGRHAGPGDHPRRVLVEIIDELIAVGDLLPGRRRNADVAAWSGVHGLALLLLDGVLDGAVDGVTDGVTDPQPLIDSTLDMIGLGLCAPALLAAGAAGGTSAQPDQASSKKPSSRRIARP